jgi:hypothetical protein
MRASRQALHRCPHGAVSQGLAARPRADEKALREAELAQVVGGVDGLPLAPTAVTVALGCDGTVPRLAAPHRERNIISPFSRSCSPPSAFDGLHEELTHKGYICEHPTLLPITRKLAREERSHAAAVLAV